MKVQISAVMSTLPTVVNNGPNGNHGYMAKRVVMISFYVN